MRCDSGMDKGSLFYTVVHLHLPEVTVFLKFVHRFDFIIVYRNFKLNCES
jgi:hypothetical protein